MLKKLRQIWKIKDLRNSILFVLFMLLIFRLAAHIPIPGVNQDNLADYFSQNQFLGLVNLFSGGGMDSFSIVAMGVAPYITASIIFQLLPMIVPALEELQKEGPSGQEKINRWTRYSSVPFAALQAFGLITILQQSGRPILGDITSIDYFLIILTMTAGSVFLMWIGELITEKGIGNGISLLILAGIISAAPTALQNTIIAFDASQILNLVLFTVIALVTVVSIVVITEAQRNIPVSYARAVRGNSAGYGGSFESYLPIRVNQAGVIPIIFAISFILFPPMIAQFFLQAKSATLANIANWTIYFFENQVIYGVLYFVMVFAFTYFYTAIIFKPDDIAENLQKQGGFVPGIRPGKSTSDYLSFVSNRILLVGAVFLSVIAVLPLVVQSVTGLTTIAIGGTGLLIIVSVVIDTVQKIDAQLTMRDYEGL